MMSGDKCIMVKKVPAEPFCEDGFFESKGRCLRRIVAAVIDVCTRGTKEHDRCVWSHRREPLLHTYCPDGFDQEDGECCKVETYDCTPESAQPLDCGDEDEFCRLGWRNLKGYGVPVERTTETAVIQKTCQKKIVRPVIREPYCERGELLEGTCLEREFFPFEPNSTHLPKEVYSCW
eukprot:Lankesteria_metandrocarpae@DN572_c0_g1_i2.p1